MLYKVLVIPFLLPENGPPKFLVVHDRMFQEWTFISGGMKIFENAEECATRELREETRSMVRMCIRENTSASVMNLLYDENGRQNYYTVFLCEMTGATEETLRDIEQGFRSMSSVARKSREMNENDDLQFLTIDEIRREPKLWSFIDTLVHDPVFSSAIDNLE